MPTTIPGDRGELWLNRVEGNQVYLQISYHGGRMSCRVDRRKLIEALGGILPEPPKRYTVHEVPHGAPGKDFELIDGERPAPHGLMAYGTEKDLNELADKLNGVE